MFVNGKNVEAKEIQPGLTRKILAYGDEMMTCEFHFEEGVVLAPHSHFNAQTSYVVSGVLEFDVDGEKVTLNVSNPERVVQRPITPLITSVFTTAPPETQEPVETETTEE